MDGAGSGSCRPGLSNSQENRNILDQTSRSLPHMAQGPDFSNRFPTTATAPQETFFQHTKSVSLIVTHASGASTGVPNSTSIVHRIEDILHFDVMVIGLPQGCFIRIPLTRSVKGSVPVVGLRHYFNLSFKLRGAETGKIRQFACRHCRNEISRDLGTLSRIDFTERQDTIALEDGKARISFKFTCHPSHDDDGTGISTDKGYIIQAVLKDELQVNIAHYEIPERFEIPRFANLPAANRRKSGEYGSPSLFRDGTCLVTSPRAPTALVPVTAPRDLNPLVPRSFPYSDSHTFPLHPINAAENLAPLAPPPALQGPCGHIHSYIPEAVSIGAERTGTHRVGAVSLLGMPSSISPETRSADMMVQTYPQPPGVLENESGSNVTVNQRHSHDLRVCPGIHDTPLGTNSFAAQQPSNDPSPTPSIGIVSNTLTGYGEGMMTEEVNSTEEILQVISPLQYGRISWTYPHDVGTAPAPMYDAGVTSNTCSITQAIPYDSLCSSPAIILPSNRSDHGIIRSTSQQWSSQEPNPRAEYVVPSKGPMAGGIEVTIVGTDFPHTLPLCVYFSTKLALITRKTRETIRCFVPAVSSPGIVDVRIVVEAPESAPEINCKLAKFVYKDERMTELMVHVRYIASQASQAHLKMTTTPTVQQAARNLEPDSSNGLRPLDDDQFEEIAIQILSSCSPYHDWRKVVSLPNEHGQTLAHLAITLGYTRLLEQLILWEIDHSARDAMGATALHFAHLYNRPDCVSLLTRNAADRQISDEPGERDVPFNRILNESSDLASAHAGSTTNLFGCGTNSLGLAGLDLNPKSPTTDQTATGAVAVEPLGAGVQGTPNRRHTIDTSLGSNAHPETSYSQTNVTRSSLWTSYQLGTLSPGVSDTPISSTASWLQSETPTIGDSSRTADGALLKAIVPLKGGSVPPQTATLATADMSSSHDERYTTQERENVEAGATYRAELAPQGSFQRMRVFESPPSTGTPTPASHVSFSAPRSPGQEASPSAVTPASRPLDGSLLSLLGTNLSYSSDTRDQHPIDLAYGGLIPPKLPPPEPYEFREMTLGCRFVATDQWLTTRVDTSWTVSQVKLHMLTKLLGARRYQLKVLNHPCEYHSEVMTSGHPVNVREKKIIATSNKSSIVFEVHESSDLNSLNRPPNHNDQPLSRPVESEPFNTEPSLSSFIQSVPTAYQTHFGPETETVKEPNINCQLSYHGLANVATPPTIIDLSADKVNKEDVLDELLDRLEIEAKERIHKTADEYCLTSFLYGNILDDRMTLGEYRLRPFELLEMQERSRLLQITRRIYLDAYWESPVEVRMRDGGEWHGIESMKKLVRMEYEEKAQQGLQSDFMAEFMSNPVDETREGPRSMATLMTLPWKNTPEARAREHETRRRKWLQKAEQEEMKRQKREIKEAAMERWMERLAIVQGHQLNVWKNRGDNNPEQSWDLRRVVEVSGPIKQPKFPPGSIAATYAALKNSDALNIIRVETKQKSDIEEEAKAPHHEIHIQFSIPMSAVNEGAAEKLKRELKKMTRPSGHGRSASLSGLPSNQGINSGTPKGTDSATLVLRLPDERSLEDLSRIIHRSAGKYPLNQKRERAGWANAVDGMITKQGTKFHPYPEWRERMLQKAIASGRCGFLASSTRKAELKPKTGEYELPPELQRWRENEGEESEPESMVSDAEWEGWRRELELESTRSGSSGSMFDGTEPPFVTVSDGLLRIRRRKNTPTLGREKGMEGILKGTTEHSVHPYSLLQGQSPGTSTSWPVPPLLASSGAGVGPVAPRPSPPSNSLSISPRESSLVPNHEGSASFSAAAKRSSHHTHDVNHDVTETSEERRLPGLGGGLSSSYRTSHTVTTIAALRSADNEAAPKKGMARVWSNKGRQRDKAEDNPTGEEAIIESAPLAVEHPDDAWTRSYNEGRDRLRYMSPSGLRQSKGGLLKSFGLRDR